MRSAVLVALLAACSNNGSDAKVVRIAAASDLTKAFAELGKEFKSRTGIEPRITFDASGVLAKQITGGTPYFLFAAANKDFIAKVVQAGKCDGSTAKLYARGRIVVWTRDGTQAPVKLADLAEPRFQKIALAEPDHAPHGFAGKQALEKAGVWPQLQGRLVIVENVRAAMEVVRDGQADAGIIALALAVVSDGGAYLPIDPTLHDPIDHQLAICGNGAESDAARQFADFIGSREGREVMTRYGFALPE